MDLLAFLRLLSGPNLLALLRRVWGWARPAQHPTVSDLHASGSAPTSASASASLPAAASSTEADAKSVHGAASSPTADIKNAKNRDATSSSLADDAKNRDAASSSLGDPKNGGKNGAMIADAASSLADPKNGGKNRAMIADAVSSLAANPRPAFRPFTRASRWASTTAVLFNVSCRRCGWESRASMEVLFKHANSCRHRRFDMEQQRREAKAVKKAGATTQQRRK